MSLLFSNGAGRRIMQGSSSVTQKRFFYHFHGNPNGVVRVPSPTSVARLTIMDYKINGMMEVRPIAAAERVEHLRLRRERARIMRTAGHTVQEVRFPLMSLRQSLAWTEFPHAVKSVLLDEIKATDFVDDVDCIINEPAIQLMMEEEKEITRVLEHPTLRPWTPKIRAFLSSLATGLPDWMFFANTEGLSLGISPLIDDRPCKLIWKPRHIERQGETAGAIRQSLEAGEVPLIYLHGSDEGRADWGQTNRDGLWIGVRSSRTDPELYSKVVDLTEALKVSGRPKEIVEVEVKQSMPGFADLRNTFYHKDLMALYIPGPLANPSLSTVAIATEAVTKGSLARLKRYDVDVTPIPTAEALAQGLNCVLLWGEKHGGVKGTHSIALMPPGCPTIKAAIESRGFSVHELSFGSPAGGGNWECETNFTLQGFEPLKPLEQRIYARMGNAILKDWKLDTTFRFICSSDLNGFSWKLDSSLEDYTPQLTASPMAGSIPASTEADVELLS
eukprot:gb/GEZN01005805.1/.p1 GENE.gb/GEZN01005805.1/~~gb/GEZN01005805.1/.p1  ORF type:complete len:502 (-),score=46.72 gb/GEZN01005805.1/:181-1686(-)